MKHPRAVLVLGEGISAVDILDILEHLLWRLKDKRGEMLKVCDIFPLICAGGSAGILAILLGRLEKSVEDCRAFIAEIERSEEVLPSWTAWSIANRALASIDTRSPLRDPAKPCKVRFIWMPRSASEGANHLVSYHNHDDKNEENFTILQAMQKCLHPRQRSSMEYPFKAMVDEVKITRDQLHGNQVCISIKTRAKRAQEAISDQFAVHDLRNGHEFHISIDLEPPDRDIAGYIEDAAEKLVKIMSNNSI
ncbi:hypothetical protein DM02DRAFT_316070 [Periconia macrospinosa]|uniref:FabD/lysophospholipase-like protein n=1 Tax=Periconia macrospinosa TaxID=97972 RepID=A0A2V1D184_9PLEO|nr:hypothetical protein DM02DRAFT_316070 [Periconia macrospinosa]